ncbi:hypothetical protein ABEF95_007877 [Exophiala dermatitidis]|uniref:Uncharacterized protein n=2 Tax=Exophiala dermatitidis TaxID=5970 RepID=H6CC21_EXODN|nr:uncharacterized protein HMPREF1120_09252 [Exophiala dermatitidis NIH/UT8656]KAJ4502604.1 hypothetical protein HRR75_008332 [Exophiala dermatitidis]EHY61318.1 hypothetical protein HMPREF1120_09252 [Exophiala dermatitidis NIH/UT8656]KAJ4533190.1 hypothetical protein HRR77_008901 [Exophiala dermatitidis]KAJ4538208.1 hypothetical protein HRR78_008269 [Exophiala dermatitidis]KAJ4555912.1 hypothetical protein HRR79_009008 [Exophiala dermatitidis]
MASRFTTPKGDDDAFSRFLTSLDLLHCDEHLTGLENAVARAEHELNIWARQLSSSAAENTTIAAAGAHERQLSNSHVRRKHAATGPAQTEGGLIAEPNVVNRLRAFLDSVSNMVAVSRELYRLWQSIWKIYEEINRPGPSKSAKMYKALFNGQYRDWLLGRLSEIEGRYERAREEFQAQLEACRDLL